MDPLGLESARVLELAYSNSFFETGLKSPLDDAILEHKEIDVSSWRKIDELSFDFELRRVSVLLDNSTSRLIVVKGAPEDILLEFFHAGEVLFHTGWFIESMATQVLVIFIIRTRKNPFKSRPNPWLIACSLTVVAAAVLLPFSPVGVHLGFMAPPVAFFLILTAMLIAYLLAVEWMKRWFFRRYAAE